jgi:hypothetical protein
MSATISANNFHCLEICLTQKETSHLHVDFSTYTAHMFVSDNPVHCARMSYQLCLEALWPQGLSREKSKLCFSTFLLWTHSLHHSCFPLIVINILEVYFIFLFFLTLRIGMVTIYFGLFTPDAWLSTVPVLKYNPQNSSMLCYLFREKTEVGSK